jgi:hypothetical protein
MADVQLQVTLARLEEKMDWVVEHNSKTNAWLLSLERRTGVLMQFRSWVIGVGAALVAMGTVLGGLIAWL